jgi:hypothetical protein
MQGFEDFQQVEVDVAIFIWLISFSSEWGFIHDCVRPENRQHLMNGVTAMPKSIVAALQIGALPGGKGETLEQILCREDAISESGAALVVMPEALGGYPKGEGWHAIGLSPARGPRSLRPLFRQRH